MHSLRFFTTPTGDYNYHLIPYPIWKKGYNKKFKELIIDSGVMCLSRNEEYPYINDYPLEDLPDNVYWVIPDYPPDVGLKIPDNLAIKKTRNNILKYKDLPNTICSVQSKFEDFYSFVKNFNWLNDKIDVDRIGIGNMCRSNNKIFLRNVINYIFRNNPKNKWIHFFGLKKFAIKYLSSKHLKFKVSVDSVKWIRIDSKFKRYDISRKRMLKYIKECCIKGKSTSLDDFFN